MKKFDKNDKDFDKYINVIIYINGLFLIESEEDKTISLKINVSNFENYRRETCDVFRDYVEEIIKKHIVSVIKKNCGNIIELSKKHGIPIKNVLHSIFINNRIDNIDILWSGSSIKEFKYIPITHYLENHEDIMYLKTKNFKFKKCW